MIPMLDLKREYEYMRKDIDLAIERTLNHQRWIQGPEVAEFEKKVASYVGTRYAIGVGSGTDALLLSLRALAIKRKNKEYFDREDEIITTPFTFTATGDTILRAGATPVFVDIDPVTFTINPWRIKEAITEKTLGIVPVHLYGLPCNMDEIIEIARKNDLFVVEDVAQAFGGKWKENILGSLGDAGVFSFFPSKNLGGFGDAGMVTTDDEEIANLIRMLGKHGGKDKYNADHIGYNSRLDTFQAAVLLAKFRYIEEFNQRRRKIAEFYNTHLRALSWLEVPEEIEGTRHVYHQYTLRVLRGKRDIFREYLNFQGISSMVYYPVPLHRMKLFRGRCKVVGELKEAEKASKEVLSIPIEPLFEEGEISRVVDAIFKWEKM